MQLEKSFVYYHRVEKRKQLFGPTELDLEESFLVGFGMNWNLRRNLAWMIAIYRELDYNDQLVIS